MSSRTLTIGIASGLALTGMGLLWAGCSTASAASSGAAAAAAEPAPSGGTLWAENCGHCHNLRSPDSYSDAQWDVVALHMRVRANLTAREHQEILAFLRSAH